MLITHEFKLSAWADKSVCGFAFTVSVIARDDEVEMVYPTYDESVYAEVRVIVFH